MGVPGPDAETTNRQDAAAFLDAAGRRRDAAAGCLAARAVLAAAGAHRSSRVSSRRPDELRWDTVDAHRERRDAWRQAVAAPPVSQAVARRVAPVAPRDAAAAAAVPLAAPCPVPRCEGECW